MKEPKVIEPNEKQIVTETVEEKEELKKVTDEMKETLNKNIIEQSILKNEIFCEVGGKKYRITRPTTLQKDEAYQKKVVKYMQLMKKKDDDGEYIYYPEKALRKLYKDRGIDIEALEETMKPLEKQKQDFQEKLGKALTENVAENQLSIYKTEISRLNDEILEIYMNRNQLLEYSLENQSLSFLYEYLTYLITDVQNEKGEWIKAFNSFEEFRKADNSSTNTIGMYAGMLLGSM